MNKLPKLLLFLATFLVTTVYGFSDTTNYWLPKGVPGEESGIMKTLEQVEPRVLITNLPWNITAPGSYYIVQSLTGVTGQPGINISSSDVKIDLNGFALNGIPGTSLDGICVLAGSFENISIRNGILRNWGNFGINATNASDVVITEVKAFGNGWGGIYAGPNSFLERCSAYGNGFSAPGGKNPPWSDAIQVYSFSTIKDCKTKGNGGAGIHSYMHSRVTGCTSVMNTNADGIALEDYCTVKDCTAAQNRNGITVGNFSRVTENTVGANGWVPSTGQGIMAGSYSVIEKNIVCQNRFGINVSGTGSLFINNYISRSGIGQVGGTNDIIGFIGGNYVGTAASFTTGYGEFTTNNPWMNFKFGGTQ